MKLIHAANELGANRKVSVAIGFFDGVHLGHHQVIRQTIADARQSEGVAVVVTFDRHPNSVLAPQRVPSLLYSLPKKLRTLESLGPDTVLLVGFDEAFSRTPGDIFIRGLARDLGRIQSICVGANFVFGHKRGGNVEMLKQMGTELGFHVHGLAAVSLDAQPVSSTRIRKAVSQGHLDQAGQMLGRPYSLSGLVVEGDKVGRELGFPTANLDVAGLVLPPNGVYAAHADTASGRFRAVLNIGNRPTLQNPAPQLRVEAHLLAFTGNLYGSEIELTIVEKLRDEKRFPGREELRAQIARDIQSAQDKF